MTTKIACEWPQAKTGKMCLTCGTPVYLKVEHWSHIGTEVCVKGCSRGLQYEKPITPLAITAVRDFKESYFKLLDRREHLR